VAEQKNRSWFRYVDDQARNWALMADTDWGENAASGLAAFNAADPPFGKQTRLHHPRRITYMDPVTFRTFVGVVGTSGAIAGLPATLAVFVPGNDTAILYSKGSLTGEKLQTPRASRHLADAA
jgi:hypothetical protein